MLEEASTVSVDTIFEMTSSFAEPETCQPDEKFGEDVDAELKELFVMLDLRLYAFAESAVGKIAVQRTANPRHNASPNFVRTFLIFVFILTCLYIARLYSIIRAMKNQTYF